MEEGINLAHTHHKDFSWLTEFKDKARSWSLCTSPGAISQCHSDGSGFGTHITMISGEKVFLIGHPKTASSDRHKIKPSPIRLEEFKNLFGDLSIISHEGWESANFDWEVVVLRDGDTL